MVGAFSSYFTYSVPLLLLTGAYVLLIDVKGYRMSSMPKEMKVARMVGWLNLVLGALLFIGKWFLFKWGW
ncbi:CLC_0170 family protein [Paenibacillus sp. NPDC056579]|uniref:CLC_0170 family protein n=1 Tax=unclassified Paenibacillus TaxID=185978 RepID=UPI001EF8C2E4|nr:CLC_0170 family protein [Paenibacillus sp. H1-7]ULL17901.1 hypothetical protein DVH26_27625 [Paenibacillus sp. H1-7]